MKLQCLHVRALLAVGLADLRSELLVLDCEGVRLDVPFFESHSCPQLVDLGLVLLDLSLQSSGALVSVVVFGVLGSGNVLHCLAGELEVLS